MELQHKSKSALSQGQTKGRIKLGIKIVRLEHRPSAKSLYSFQRPNSFHFWLDWHVVLFQAEFWSWDRKLKNLLVVPYY